MVTLFLLLVEAAVNIRDFVPHPSGRRRLRSNVLRRSRSWSNPLRGFFDSRTNDKQKSHRKGGCFVCNGGGGGNRTRVRKSSAIGSTC